MNTPYSKRELDMYERGRRAGYTAGRIEGVSEAIAAMTQAGRALARNVATPEPIAKPKRRQLTMSDLFRALMEST